MHSPLKIRPHRLANYLEIMSKAIFQTGISWRVVDSKWPGIKEAFKGFEPTLISKLTLEDIDALVADTRVIRNRRKIEAIVDNARRMIEIGQDDIGFKKYLRSFNSYEQLVSDLKMNFRFLGDSGAYYFLWVVGEKVPSWDEWNASRPLPRPRTLSARSRSLTGVR
jgi:3-methyladenine DNA glycosylase Tag